jgi:tripartite-type tricarboxylate transporter receptor subunit TctC
MPPAVVERLNEAIGKVAAMPEVAQRLRESLYREPASGSAASFRQYIDTELAKSREVGGRVKLTMTGN